MCSNESGQQQAMNCVINTCLLEHLKVLCNRSMVQPDNASHWLQTTAVTALEVQEIKV